MEADLPAYDIGGATQTYRDHRVPRHWNILRLRFVMSQQLTNGLFKKGEFWGDGTPIVNVSDVYAYDDIVNQENLDRLVAPKLNVGLTVRRMKTFFLCVRR